jgi:uroporphyrinogen decarboxylase
VNDRERFLACMLGQPVDRPPYWLFWGPWETTWQRWEREGKPAHLRSWGDVTRYFGADVAPMGRVVPVNTGPCPAFERTVLAEDDESVVFIDSWGIKRRDFKHLTSMSEFLEFPVKTRADWEKFRNERLDPGHPDRLSGDWQAVCAEWMARGEPIQLGWYPDAGVFGPYRWLLGDEEGLMAFRTMPDLVHEIMDHLTTLYLTVFEEVVKVVRVDMIHFWEDMCYRAGPLISPRFFNEFMAPNYCRIRAFADRHHIPLISVDTDGKPDLLVPPMMRAGVNMMYPLEVAAGCDVNEWQRRYPMLAVTGGIDKRALAAGPQAIDRELERIRPAVERGRYIPDLDHLIPDDVSWDNYCHYAEALRSLVGKT